MSWSWLAALVAFPWHLALRQRSDSKFLFRHFFTGNYNRRKRKYLFINTAFLRKGERANFTDLLCCFSLRAESLRSSRSVFLFPTDLGRSKRLCSQGSVVYMYRRFEAFQSDEFTKRYSHVSISSGSKCFSHV